MAITTGSTRILTTDDVDAKAQVIVDEYKAGTRSEESARGSILVLLQRTDILPKVASGPHVKDHERDPLETALRDLMIEKVITPNGDKNFSLELIDGKSVCGWYRKFATTARDSELRNLRSATRRFGPPVDHTSIEEPPNGAADQYVYGASLDTPWSTNAALHRSNDEILRDEATAELTEEFIQKARYLRGDRIGLIQAEYLRRYFNLPSAARPVKPRDREFVLKMLEKDDNAAYRSASVAFQLRVGDIESHEVTTDKRMIDLWSRQSVSSLNTLLDSPGKVAHTIAMAAAMLRPRPSSVCLDRFRRMVHAASALPEWHDLADRLADAYIAIEFAALSAYNEHRLDDDELAETEALHSEHAKSWTKVSREAAKFLGAPMGSDVESVRSYLEAYASAAKAFDVGTKE